MIGSLQVEFMDHGVVWSGKLNSPSSVVTNLLSDDFAAIPDVQVGCIGPRADLWVTDVAAFTVSGDVFGEIHLGKLTSEQAVRIGGRLGNKEQALAGVGFCQADEIRGGQAVIVSVAPIEDSPRGVWIGVDSDGSSPTGIAEHGRIRLHAPARLEGQIIIDASNTTGIHRTEAWQGSVAIGSPPSIILSCDPDLVLTAKDRGPMYERLPAQFGGGAVGLVPFGVHVASSDAINDAGQGLLNTGLNPPFDCDQWATLDFYGPLASIEGAPVRV